MTFQKYQMANNAKGQLDVGISAVATNVILKAGYGALFPAHNGTTDKDYLATLVKFDTDGVTVLKREIVKVTARSTDTFTIERSAGTCPGSDAVQTQGTTAYQFDANDYFFLINSAEIMKDIQDEVENISDELPNKLDISVYNQEKTAFGATSTGNDDYSATIAGVSAYVNGQTFKIQADVANIGSATLNINSLGVKTLKKLKSSAFTNLETGDIIANQIFRATYNLAENCFQFSIDPANTVIAVPDASTTVKGIIEIATPTEAVAGLSTNLAVTPEGAKQVKLGGDYDIEMNIPSWLNKSGGGITVTDYFNRSKFDWSSASPRVFSSLPMKNGTARNQTNKYQDFSVIELECGMAFDSGSTPKRRIGFGEDTAFFTETTTLRHVCIDHKLNNAFVTLDTADGTTQSAGANCAVPSYSQYQKYKLVWTVGVDVKLYVNGVLCDTKTTNLPTGNFTMYFGLGATANVSSSFFLQDCTLRLKFS